MKRMQIEKRIIITIIIAITLIASGLTYYTIDSCDKSITQTISTTNELFTTSEIEIIESYEKFSNFVFDAIVNDEEITKLMYEANNADETDESEIASIREELYEKLINYYDILNQYSFRQMQFHLPNGDSFLRFNSPEKYGDNLMEIRPSIRIANEEGRYVSGFEGGRIFNGYRFVYPLIYDGAHVGSVEISVSMESILTVLSKAYPDICLGFILKKDLVESIVFEEDLTRYYPCSISADYVIEEDIFSFMLNNPNNQALYEDESFMEKLSDKVRVMFETQESFSCLLEYNGENYLIQFEAVRNIEDEPVGYLFFIGINDQIKTIKRARTIELASIIFVFVLLISILLIAKHTQKKIYSLAMRDPLTKTYNRYAFFEFAQKEVANSERTDIPICFALLDIDHFKTVNDKYGHVEGDNVLKILADIIEKSIRELDVLGRYGGEEFILMLKETNMVQATEVAERIRSNIERHYFSKTGKITVSIGLANKTKDENVDQAIERADQALYRAKRNGRNQVCSDSDGSKC